MPRRTKNHRLAHPLIVLLLLAATAARGETPPGAQEGETRALGFLDALASGEVHLGLRYRFEAVDDDAFDASAEASTLRTTLSYRSAEWRGWSLFLEAEDVTAIPDDDDYRNAGAGALDNGVRGVPVVADPEVTDVNQAYVRWRGDRLQASFGRQEINLGDQRFVGAVGWRQNHQSFDAARLEARITPRFAVDYTFADAALRIFGDHVDMSSHFLLAPVELAKDHRLTPYGFYLDFEEAALASTSTFGAEYVGTVRVSERLALRFELEAAEQQDAAENPLSIDTEYRLASIGVTSSVSATGPIGFDLTWELLGGRGDGARAFQTPLATLHKWNGWADKFLQTPGLGLETLYLRFKASLGESWRLSAVYHEFTSDEGDFDYGSEIDAELVYQTPWKQTVALKLASYDADLLGSDTEKIMLWSSYSF